MPAMKASVVIGSRRGLATTLSPTHTASYPASSARRAIAQHSSTGGRRAECITTPRVGIRTPTRMERALPALHPGARLRRPLHPNVRSRGLHRRASVLRQAEHAFADDVALDLAGAAGDRVLPRAHHAVVPAGSVGDVRARLIQEHARAE